MAGLGADDNDLFKIEGGQLSWNGRNLADFESGKTRYGIRVRAFDDLDSTLTSDSVWTIRVADVNEAPLDFQISSDTLLENSLAGTVIGQVVVIDPDQNANFAQNNIALVGGFGDNALFAVVDGALVWNSDAPDFEKGKTGYQIKLNAQDANDSTLSISKELTTATTVPTLNVPSCNLASIDQSVPMIRLYNRGSVAIPGLKLEYYFTAQKGEPVLSIDNLPCPSSLEKIEGNVYKFVYDCSEKLIGPGQKLRAIDEGRIRLHYAKWTTWDEYDDYSHQGMDAKWRSNDKIVVTDGEGNVLWGVAPK